MQVIISKKAKKQLKKLDSPIQERIAKFFDELETLENPRCKGKPLIGNLGGFWRYRVGDYRIICEILDRELIIYAFSISHRKESY